MRLLLTAEGTPIVSARDFFNHHLAPWVVRFFDDMTQAESADFYQHVGEFAKRFMILEERKLVW